tara:strand:- start:16 stop:741 length:726 start_codon:yes stop_codon:yes gene_type:complete
MKAIILAAGKGTRLKPLTDNYPKCMVEFRGKQIIDYILEALRSKDINDISIVKGYKASILKKEGTKEYINDLYETTNMVYSLFCSKNEWNDDIIISYSDIIFNAKHLELLINSESNISVIIDKDWRKLWEKRMDDPLLDAETLKLDENDNIIEIGKKPLDYSEINGQYTGLIKIKKNVLLEINNLYDSLDKEAYFDGQTFKNMYMTSFLQIIIDRLMPIKAIQVQGGWVEIDTIEDLKRLS